MNSSEGILRKEAEILSRIDNVKRLIQMETTLAAAYGTWNWSRYCLVDREGSRIGNADLMQEIRDEIQVQLLSITAMCHGDYPDICDSFPMLEFKRGCEDKFRETWDECLAWNI